MAVDKQALLDAVAQRGTAGRKAYEDAQKALGGQQSDAIRSALANGVASQAPAGAQAELSRIVGVPYQNRQAQLTSDLASQEDWYNRAGTSAGQWADNMTGMHTAVTTRAEQERALVLELQRIEWDQKMKEYALRMYSMLQGDAESGGGGGGSGGSGSGGSGIDDWYENVKDLFGTGENAESGIWGEAMQSVADTPWGQIGEAPHAYAQRYATEKFGVPAGVAGGWYPQPKEDVKFQDKLRNTFTKIAAKPKKKQARAATNALTNIRAAAKTTPGNQKYLVAQAKAAKQAIKKKPKKKPGGK